MRVQRREPHPESVLALVGGESRPKHFASVPHIRNWSSRKMFLCAMRANTIAQAQQIYCADHGTRANTDIPVPVRTHVMQMPQTTGAYTLGASGSKPVCAGVVPVPVRSRPIKQVAHVQRRTQREVQSELRANSISNEV